MKSLKNDGNQCSGQLAHICKTCTFATVAPSFTLSILSLLFLFAFSLVPLLLSCFLSFFSLLLLDASYLPPWLSLVVSYLSSLTFSCCFLLFLTVLHLPFSLLFLAFFPCFSLLLLPSFEASLALSCASCLSCCFLPSFLASPCCFCLPSKLPLLFLVLLAFLSLAFLAVPCFPFLCGVGLCVWCWCVCVVSVGVCVGCGVCGVVCLVVSVGVVVSVAFSGQPLLFWRTAAV